MRSRAGLFESACKVLAQQCELAFDAAGAADHDVIGAGETVHWNDFPGKRAEAPLHPVSDDGVADLFADRESNAHQRVAFPAIADEEHESRRCGTPSGVRGQEIRAFLENRERF